MFPSNLIRTVKIGTQGASPQARSERLRLGRTINLRGEIVCVVAAAATANIEYVRGLGAERIVDYKAERFEGLLTGVDIVLDTVGGDTQQRSLRVLKPGGILVSVISPVPETLDSIAFERRTFMWM
jgi:NADPH:quinone reductase-like Zn-dependent oxidoreductase